MPSLPTPDALQLTLTLSTLAGIWLAWAKVVGPRVKTKWNWFVGIFQSVGGRAAIIDKRTGEELSPEVPHLGMQLATINKTMVKVDDTMARLVAVVDSTNRAHHRLDQHDEVLADHGSTLAALIGGTYERGAKDLLNAVEKQQSGVIDVDPT